MCIHWCPASYGMENPTMRACMHPDAGFKYTRFGDTCERFETDFLALRETA